MGTIEDQLKDMSPRKALEIIRGLAEGNALDFNDCGEDDELIEEAARQEAAFIVFDRFMHDE